jgi:hypothetical protein
MPVRCKTFNPHHKYKMTFRVILLRSERGYSATDYDASVVTLPKTLRRQIGPFYDAN